jgi:hypothetical protein
VKNRGRVVAIFLLPGKGVLPPARERAFATEAAEKRKKNDKSVVAYQQYIKNRQQQETQQTLEERNKK